MRTVVVGGREAPIKINHRAETRDVPDASAVDAKLDVGLLFEKRLKLNTTQLQTHIFLLKLQGKNIYWLSTKFGFQNGGELRD
jgi:hypothetical protein